MRQGRTGVRVQIIRQLRRALILPGQRINMHFFKTRRTRHLNRRRRVESDVDVHHHPRHFLTQIDQKRFKQREGFGLELVQRVALTIAPQADNRAQVIKVEGVVEGDLHAERSVFVAESGNLRGNIHAPSVCLVEGSHFNGAIDMDMKKAAQQGSRSDGKAARATAPGKTGTGAG